MLLLVVTVQKNHFQRNKKFSFVVSSMWCLSCPSEVNKTYHKTSSPLQFILDCNHDMIFFFKTIFSWVPAHKYTSIHCNIHTTQEKGECYCHTRPLGAGTQLWHRLLHQQQTHRNSFSSYIAPHPAGGTHISNCYSGAMNITTSSPEILPYILEATPISTLVALGTSSPERPVCLDIFSRDILGNVSSWRCSHFLCLALERSQELNIASAIHMKCTFMSAEDI